MRRLILVFCCFILVSCTNNSTYQEQLKLYKRLVNETSSNEPSKKNTELPFDISFYFEKVIDDEVTYRIIIDNPKQKVYNIKAIAVHDYKTDDIYPTTGIFEEPLHLIPNTIDLQLNYAKGIILVGYIDYKGEVDELKISMKMIIEYENDKGEVFKIYHEYHK